MNKLKEIIELYTHETFYNMGNYTQFTIDWFDELETDIIDYEEDSMITEEILTQSKIYQVENIVEVLREGKDKEFFEKLLKDLNQII